MGDGQWIVEVPLAFSIHPLSFTPSLTFYPSSLITHPLLLPLPFLPMLLQSQSPQKLRDILRPGQREIADWQEGPLAVSAVPGSGKSTGMAVAAAIAIARHQLNNRRQLVVVTFTRSAAANIKAKIRGYLKELSLPPAGFTVQTLHGLAWAIARAHPELSGLTQDSVLVTPNQSHRLIRTCVEQWISANSRHYQTLIEGQQFDGEETERLRRQSVLRTEVLPALASTVIHEAKSSGLLPDDLRRQSNEVSDPYSTLTIAAGLYEFYQTQLQFRRFIDYDEMILGLYAFCKIREFASTGRIRFLPYLKMKPRTPAHCKQSFWKFCRLILQSQADKI